MKKIDKDLNEIEEIRKAVSIIEKMSIKYADKNIENAQIERILHEMKAVKKIASDYTKEIMPENKKCKLVIPEKIPA